jgi:hypothetical protein
LKANPGTDKMVIIIPNGAMPERIIVPYKVKYTEALAKQVEQLLA